MSQNKKDPTYKANNKIAGIPINILAFNLSGASFTSQ